MTLVPSVPYRYASPAQYDAIAVFAITTIILDIPAVSLLFGTLKSPFGQGFVTPWFGVVVATAIAASILTARIIPWYLAGSYRLVISNADVTLCARDTKFVISLRTLVSCRIDIVTNSSALRFNTWSKRDFGNWTKKAPEYAGSSIDFEVSRPDGSDVFSFPLGMNFADANAIAAAIPGIPLAITRNGETQVR